MPETSERNVQILLDSRPTGWVTPENFRLVESAIPVPAEGQVLVRNRWLSLDPYMRGRISDAKSYAQGVAPGEVMVGGTVGEVVASHSDRFAVGDIVLAATGWQKFAVISAAQALRIDTREVPPQAYLGVLGMPGITAWTGLMDICQPKKGETLVVDAASGAVGSVVGQLGKHLGCRVVGIAGGSRKCNYVVDTLGFDACIDHRAPDFADQLAQALPDGIDCLFENVGGEIFELLLTLMRPFSRIALCGMISDFNREPHACRTLRAVLVNRIRLQGFIVSDKMETWPSIRRNLHGLLIAGKLRYQETIADGLASAPAAFVGMLRGENFGKQLVRIG
ncbi:MAG: NADP-dependent oxidoreductase [Burkholderiaceae bacterium]|nr:NADP-dependent oxidoreductase [Burkholderiaceae bacterium]